MRSEIGQSAQERVARCFLDRPPHTANKVTCGALLISQNKGKSGGVVALRTYGRSRLAVDDVGRWAGGIASSNSIPICVRSRSDSRMTASDKETSSCSGRKSDASKKR